MGGFIATHPYAYLVKEVTGVPVAPESIEGLSMDSDTIRGFVCDAVAKMVHDHFPHANYDLTAEQVAKLRQLPGIQQVGAELQAANDTLVNWHNPPQMPPYTEGSDTPRGIVQAKALKRQVEHSQKAPVYSNNPDSPYSDGLLVVGPTGIGKTVFQGLNLNYAGIGQPISEALPMRRKAVGILHSIGLLNQWLDPNETLQRFANVGGRTVRVGAYHAKRRDGHDEYDYLLTTPNSYEKAVQNGAIDLTATVRFILDEAHLTAMAPGMQRSISKWGQGLYMYTATPAIARGMRDLRKQFPHVQLGSLREYVHDGILSPAQLFSYRAGPEPLAAEKKAIRLAIDMLESGRKTLIVCQPGGKLTQARNIASEINRLYRDGAINLPSSFDKIEGNRIACAVGGSVPSLNTQANLRLVKAGKRVLMTAVAYGREGLNIPDLDGLIVIGPWGAQWIIDQWLGRVMRPSGQPIIASEIFPHVLPVGTPLASIFRSFGIEDGPIMGGYYVGPHPDDRPEELPEVESSNMLGRTVTQAALDPPSSSDSVQTAPPELYTPPAELRDALIDNVSFREATIAPQDLAKLPPSDYRPLGIELPEGVPIEWAYGVLDRLNNPEIRYVGTWEKDKNGDKYFVRHYSPAAHEYFENHPVPELASEAEFTVTEIANMLGVSYTYVMAMAANLGIQPVPKLGKKRKQNTPHHNMDALMRFKQEVDKVPLATDTDVAVNELGDELGISDIHLYLQRYKVESIDKWRNLLWGGRNVICKHITESEAYFLREIQESVQDADPDLHIGITEIVTQAEITITAFWTRVRKLPEAKQPIFEWMSTKRPDTRRFRRGQFMDKEYGEALLEYVKPEKLLPWEVTMGLLCNYFENSRDAVRLALARLKIKGDEVQLPKTNRKVLVYPMTVIPALINEGLKPVENAPAVATGLAALSPKDIKDEKRVAYSQKLQKHFLPPEYIPATDEIAHYKQRREQPPTVPDAVMPARAGAQSPSPAPVSLQPDLPPYSEFSDNPDANPAHPEARTPLTGQLPSAVQASRPQFRAAKDSAAIPEGYVNLRHFFQEEGVGCTRNLLLALARQQGINSKQWSFTSQGIFTSRSDATTLALAILEHDIAPEPTGNPETDQVPAHLIAAEFSDKTVHLAEGDIHKVAVRLLQQRAEIMESVASPWRERLPDGSGGILVTHYKKRFADLVRKELEKLKIRKQLASIRKW